MQHHASVLHRLFIGGAWLAKATVQAALASAPLDLITAYKRDSADYDEWHSWGKDIVTTAVFSIVITAPLGLIFITYFGDKVSVETSHVQRTTQVRGCLGQTPYCC
jgi:solute carrier family 9B (sodium/hydrogen exchanger), member 1/2